jgi:hypothetical protein
MGEVLARLAATYAAFVAITPAGSGAGLHPQAQPQGRSKAEDGAARHFLALGEVDGDHRISHPRLGSRRFEDSRAAVAGPRRFRPDRPLEGRRAGPFPAAICPDNPADGIMKARA